MVRLLSDEATAPVGGRPWSVLPQAGCGGRYVPEAETEAEAEAELASARSSAALVAAASSFLDSSSPSSSRCGASDSLYASNRASLESSAESGREGETDHVVAHDEVVLYMCTCVSKGGTHVCEQGGRVVSCCVLESGAS